MLEILFPTTISCDPTVGFRLWQYTVVLQKAMLRINRIFFILVDFIWFLNSEAVNYLV
jgi:hypothetical protein